MSKKLVKLRFQANRILDTLSRNGQLDEVTAVVKAASNDPDFLEEVLGYISYYKAGGAHGNAQSNTLFVALADYPSVCEHITAVKAQLRMLIDEAGGISIVAQRARMSASSLSRMLASDSRPRSSTMPKLGKALKVDGVTIKNPRHKG